MGLSDLPTEVLQHALSFVDLADLCRVEALNHAWRRFVSDETIWRVAFAHRFSAPPPNGSEQTWRERCKEAAKRANSIMTRPHRSAEDRTLDLFRWACACGHHRLCERLMIEHRSALRPESFERAGSTTFPLHLAVLSGSTQAVEVLVRAGFDIHWRQAHGATAINLAAQHGKLEVFEMLLRCGASDAGETDKLDAGTAAKPKGRIKGMNAIPLLHQAAACGHVNIVQALLSRVGPSEEQRRAYINKPDGRTGRTALHYAVEEGHLDVVRLLLALGAKNMNRQAPQWMSSPFHWACRDQATDMVDAFLESGAADIEMLDAYGETPLKIAAKSSEANSAFVRHLIDRWGADKRACMDILHSTNNSDNNQAQKGANVNALNRTPICFVARENDEMLGFLVFVHDLYWNTAQDRRDECCEIARNLIRLGADPTKCVDAQGLDPYQFLLRQPSRAANVTAQWLALAAELGVPIDTTPLAAEPHQDEDCVDQP